MDPRNSNSGCFREHLKIGTNDDISGKVASFSGKLATLPFGHKSGQQKITLKRNPEKYFLKTRS